MHSGCSKKSLGSLGSACNIQRVIYSACNIQRVCNIQYFATTALPRQQWVSNGSSVLDDQNDEIYVRRSRTTPEFVVVGPN